MRIRQRSRTERKIVSGRSVSLDGALDDAHDRTIDVGLAELVFRDDGHAGVHFLFDWFAVEGGDDSFHTFVAHLERILHDQRVNLPGLESVEQRLLRVEADHFDFTALLADQPLQRADGGRGVAGVKALHVLVFGQQVE